MNIGGSGTFKAELRAKVIRQNPLAVITFREKLYMLRNRLLRGDENDYGVVCRKFVTTAGVLRIAQFMVGTENSSAIVWAHMWGTGTTDENVAQINLITPTAPTAASTVTGTKVAAASGANATITSSATITAAGSVNITEHAIWIGDPGTDDAMLDRSKFTAIPLESGNSIAFTYVLTLNSGG